MSATFDILDHDLLIHRLSSIGITGSALSWVKSYISDRSFVIGVGQF